VKRGKSVEFALIECVIEQYQQGRQDQQHEQGR
jgi:hypothetical protein